MLKNMTLIFLPLLLVGVVSSLAVNEDKDGETLRPFVSNSHKRRICVDLCLSGLGGMPCGEECADITPQDLPVQSNLGNSTEDNVSKNLTRDNACTILCSNNLGYPLCVCDNSKIQKLPEGPDFLQICSFFCLNYNYRINGCQKCSIYKSSISNKLKSNFERIMNNYDTTVDWGTWCLNQCSKGNGGAACNCDRLPL